MIARALAVVVKRAPGIEAAASLAMITAGAWLTWSLGIALLVTGAIVLGIILAAAAWPMRGGR